SPLIVPTFYNMARQALALPKIYYTLGDSNRFDIALESAGDAVLSLRKDEREFIPMQQKQGGKITLFTQDALENEGIYAILYQKEPIANVAYNYNRKESRLDEIILPDLPYINTGNSVSEVLNKLQQATNLNLLYKWFVIFALALLLLEMLILKYFK
ncbi:MAG: hypothetical protein V7767_02075, partial [Leeuwenhoekiella sp.]